MPPQTVSVHEQMVHQSMLTRASCVELRSWSRWVSGVETLEHLFRHFADELRVPVDTLESAGRHEQIRCNTLEESATAPPLQPVRTQLQGLVRLVLPDHHLASWAPEKNVDFVFARARVAQLLGTEPCESSVSTCCNTPETNRHILCVHPQRLRNDWLTAAFACRPCSRSWKSQPGISGPISGSGILALNAPAKVVPAAQPKGTQPPVAWCRLLKQLSEYKRAEQVDLHLLDSADSGATPHPRCVSVQSLPLKTQAEQATVGMWMKLWHAEAAERFLGVEPRVPGAWRDTAS